jgi:murein DD-endopeptidase MepM/ murein hydrolase activator NlpD
MTGSIPNLGITLQMKHADNTVSTYVHLNAANVKPGDHVRAGERIGTLGDNHLHVEVRKNSRVVDPSVLLRQ